MRVAYVLAAIVAMTVSVFGVVLLFGTGRPDVSPNMLQPVKNTAPDLEVSATGPFPKVMVDVEFDFGRMEVGESRSHVFSFRNEGEGLLKIENGGTTCQCTVSDMKQGETREIAPGKSTDVTLTWKPEVQAEKFNKGADFNTNDPDPKKKKIALRIVGMVAPRIVISPEREWYLPNVTDGKPSVFSGTVMSPITDQFQIVSVECRSPLATTEVVPLSKEKMEIHKGKCGYEIRVTVKPEMPLGVFRFPMTIKTDLPERTAEGLGKPMEFEVLVGGIHRGPIQPAGREWIDDKMAISMGSFEASAGKKVRLPLFVKSPPEGGLQLTAPAICTPEALKFDIEREEKPGSPVRYFLTVEYPAGAPRATHREETPARIKLQTNHPHGQEAQFLVFFTAY